MKRRRFIKFLLSFPVISTSWAWLSGCGTDNILSTPENSEEYSFEYGTSPLTIIARFAPVVTVRSSAGHLYAISINNIDGNYAFRVDNEMPSFAPDEPIPPGNHILAWEKIYENGTAGQVMNLNIWVR